MNRRLESVDFVRGVAILAVIQTHVWEFYMAKPDGWGSHLLKWLVAPPLRGYAAPLFILVAGLSAHLSVRSLYLSAAQDGKPSSSRFFIRGGFLLALSTGLNVVTGPVLHLLPISILNWSTIQLIGFCLCLVPVYARLRPVQKVVWLAVPLILSEWHYLGGLSLPLLFDGFAPPFPWAFLFFAGLAAGEGYTLALDKLSLRRLWLLALTGGLLAGPTSLLLDHFYRPFDPNHVATPAITAVCAFVGTFLLLVATCGYLLDWGTSRRRSLATRLVAGWGQHSLSIYCVQLVGIVGSAIILSTVTGSSIRLGWAWFGPSFLLALLLIYLTFDIVWARFDYVLGLEWVFRKLLVVSHKPGLGDRQAARP
jgi:uncharacterized membrane protein